MLPWNCGSEMHRTRSALLLRLASVLACSVALFSTGCSIRHTVAFDSVDTSWHYRVTEQRVDAAIAVVIDRETTERAYPIRSFMAGRAHEWNAQPGLMLKQVADIELPQLFADYACVTEYNEPKQRPRRITLVLTITSFTFADFHTTVTVQANAFGPQRVALFEKKYTGEGMTQGAKMFWAGAFGMKSAIRQSTLDAYKNIFEQLRSDLRIALNDPMSLA